MAYVTLNGIASSDDFWLPIQGAAILESRNQYRFFNGSYYISVYGDNFEFAAGLPTAGTVSAVLAYSDNTFSDAALVGIVSGSSAFPLSQYFIVGASLALSGDDFLEVTANGGGQIQKGYDGNDRLDGSRGACTLIGGSGNDAYVTSGDDVIVEESAGGDDIIAYTGTDAVFDLANFVNVESVNVGGTQVAKIIGTAGNNRIYGNYGANEILAGDGADLIVGGQGNDTIDGGAGADTVIFNGALASYSIAYDASTDTFTVRDTNRGSNDGIDLVRNCETFVFQGRSYTRQQVQTAPTDITLSTDVVAELSRNGTVVGTLSTIGTSDGANLKYQLEKSAEGRFEIQGDKLVVANGFHLDFEQAVQHDVVIRVFDDYGRTVAKTISIHVSDVATEVVKPYPNSPTLNHKFLGGPNGDTFYSLAPGTRDGVSIGTDLKFVGGKGSDKYHVNDASQVVEAPDGGNDTVYYYGNNFFVLPANIENAVLSGDMGYEVRGNHLANTVTGANGADLVLGGGGNDRIFGEGGADELSGDNGNDVLSGGAGADNLFGGNGNDRLDGGKGNDTLSGGVGHDTFLFNSALKNNIDTISDFYAPQDTIALDHTIFTALGPRGGLAKAHFLITASGVAKEADDRIIYNLNTGALTYDADGNGAGRALQFAVIVAKTMISPADFIIV